MKTETRVIYFDEREFTRRIHLHEKLIPGVEASLRELRGLGIEPSIEKLLKLLGGGTSEIIQEWQTTQLECTDSFQRFQRDQYTNNLVGRLSNIMRSTRDIPQRHLSTWEVGNLYPMYSISNYEIASNGKVVLAESFVEEQRDELSIYANTPEKIKTLDLSEKACKALNELHSYLKKLEDEGAICAFNAVFLNTAYNTHLIPYDYDTNRFYIDHSVFGDVGVKPLKRVNNPQK